MLVPEEASYPDRVGERDLTMIVIVVIAALATMRGSFRDHLLERPGGLLESLYGVGASCSLHDW